MMKKIFLNDPLSTLAEQNLNREMKGIVISAGFECYIPQEILIILSCLAPIVGIVVTLIQICVE